MTIEVGESEGSDEEREETVNCRKKVHVTKSRLCEFNVFMM